jgi:DNA-binding transcriptional regulator GbsR (MarR family)
MSEQTLTVKQRELIEQLGIAHEKSGMQPIPSRILGLLLVSDKTELTFEEIQNSLKISKSSTSASLNLLISLNRIEYITYPGIRKRYFRLKIFNWKEEMKMKMEEISQISTLFKEVVKQRPKSTREFNQSLYEIVDFFDFFNNEVPAIFKKWEQKYKKSREVK